MKKKRNLTSYFVKTLLVFLLFIATSNAQILQVEIIGGAIVSQGSTVTINAGSSLDFRMTNVETGNCGNLIIEDVDISNTTDFDISPNNPSDRIKPASCRGDHDRDFTIENISGSCATTSTLVTIEIRNQSDFTFTLQVNSSPEIYVLGGNPFADIYHGDTVTSDVNGTYFGVVEEGATETRMYAVANIGSCDLDITSITSSNGDFYVTPLVYDSYFSSYAIPHYGINPYDFRFFFVTFTAPVSGTGTQTSTISIGNNDNTTFTFDVSAEMFNYSIPGPGGITANFRLWLKSTRGITTTGSSLTDWLDVGTNGKDATTVAGKEPTYLDTATDNINFNPVVKFENDGGATEQYMYNNDSPLSGFYSADIFIVMLPDETMTSGSSRNTIFGGVDSDTAGDVTGIGFGDYSTGFTNETLSYNQDIPGTSTFNGEAELSTSYSKVGIINVRNDATSPTKQEILYNSNLLTTSNVSNSFANINGNKYWIGRNRDLVGSLNGRVAEIFTFGTRVDAIGRQKIESYLAIKYGITLGALTEAQKNYVNSFGTAVWDITTNSGYNYHIAGIGRDDDSDLNQKQSKTVNLANEVTIGLGGIFTTNSANTNEFEEDGDFLIWGNNNAAFTGSNTNTVTIDTGITTSLTRIDRKWKIVESNEDINGDVETVYVSIPLAAFSGFSKLATEEYALIVADDPNFSDGDIIDVIPLRSDGGSNLLTWYDFDGTKYFTFGKTANLSQNHSVSLASGDYLVGESDLNLSVDSFSISAWIKCAANASNRTIMSKGEKLQIRLNTSGNIEVFIDDAVIPKFTSNMDLDDGKWHHTAFIYNSGTILMYVDGVLDKSIQDVVHPSPNYNNYCVGAVYIGKNNVINPLLGEIDEVYVWDLALSEVQVRYLMNQELEKVAGNLVSGKIIPTAASSNEVSTIPWGSLRVYYDFNSFYGSTVEGLTDERYYLRLKYLDKDKTIVDTQTAPLPYISAANGAWDTPATWSNNVDQVIPNSVSLDGTTIIDWNIVQISHNITSGDRDISLLGLIQVSDTLTISDPVITSPIENNAGQSLTISHYLELDGVIDLVGESQLIQTEGSIVDADSGGFIERDQQGTANGFNYNYWSSSVGPIGGNDSTRGTGISNTNSSYTIAGVLNDGTISDSYQNILFSTSLNGSGTPPPPGFGAQTISTAWLYKFNGPFDDYDSWEKIDETASLLAGEGFTMKGTGGNSAISVSTLQNYVFKGLPNNGDISLPLTKNITGTNPTGDVERLIGNPYPSAIDAEAFILDNMSIADGGNNTSGTIFNGALYFWDHFGEENSHYLRAYVGGYATRNLTGGAAAISNDSRINNTSDSGNPATGTKVPGQYIPVNQGFFVRTALDGFDNDNGVPIATVDGGNIVFQNSQRVFATEDGSTSLFFKSSLQKQKKQQPQMVVEQNKTPTIRLIYDSPLGYHRQIVIGANDKATDDFDLGYDAFMADISEEDMYWMLRDNEFVIQGVNEFNKSQEFPLGVKVKKAGLAKIKLESLENMVDSMDIYIKDKLTNETYKINNDAFEMYLDPGTYNERFLLAFNENKQSELLSVEENAFLNDISIYYDSNKSSLHIEALKEGVSILSVKVFSLIGQRIKSVIANSKEITIPMTVSTGVYVLKCHTEKGVVSKKILIN